MDRVRIGVLGAASIAEAALVRPARDVAEVAVTAIAARDPDRAAAYARRHGIPAHLPDYDALLADPDIDAVYLPLPNGLHAPWTLRAIAAGKHVLCEKPFTANAGEARAVAQAAAAAGVVVMEAFHYRYHPLAAHMADVVASGQLGTIREVSTSVCFPLPKFRDIRYRYDLGGGAMMDAGCYALHCLRLLGPGLPEVVAARARLRSPDVDRAMSARLRFPDGAVGRVRASMWSGRILDISARVTGDRGQMRVLNFVAPHLYNRLTVTTGGSSRRLRVRGEPTYTCQLRAFAGAVLRGEPYPTTPEDAVVTMGLIDDAYRAAGLTPRGRAAEEGRS